MKAVKKCQSNDDKENSKRILIVDDHPVLRRGLSRLIESEPDFVVCGEAENYASAVEKMSTHAPDLAIVDLALEGSDGLDLVKTMKSRFSQIPALVFSMYAEEVFAEKSLRAGARGYVCKQQLDEVVLQAIHEVLNGNIYLSESSKAMLLRHSKNEVSPGFIVEKLSDRELQVFRYIGTGESTRNIADILCLSVKTIESHREHIKHKLLIENGTELNRRAILWYEYSRLDSKTSSLRLPDIVDG